MSFLFVSSWCSWADFLHIRNTAGTFCACLSGFSQWLPHFPPCSLTHAGQLMKLEVLPASAPLQVIYPTQSCAQITYFVCRKRRDDFRDRIHFVQLANIEKGCKGDRFSLKEVGAALWCIQGRGTKGRVKEHGCCWQLVVLKFTALKHSFHMDWFLVTEA